MRKSWLILAGGFLVAFALVSLVKSEGEAVTPGASIADAAARDSARAFWELYRTATDLRTAGRTKEAMRAFENLLDIDPDHEGALYYLGNMYVETDRLDDARRLWEHLIVVNPASSKGYLRLGDAAFCFPESAGFDLEKAARFYASSLEINQEETGPLLRLGLLEVVRRNDGEAATYLQAVTRSNFKSVPAYFFQGYLAWASGDKRMAERLFETALQYLAPSDTSHVIGEGDTRGGGAPESAADVDCPAVDRLMAELHTTDRSRITSEMEVRYETVRRHVAAVH